MAENDAIQVTGIPATKLRDAAGMGFPPAFGTDNIEKGGQNLIYHNQNQTQDGSDEPEMEKQHHDLRPIRDFRDSYGRDDQEMREVNDDESDE